MLAQFKFGLKFLILSFFLLHTSSSFATPLCELNCAEGAKRACITMNNINKAWEYTPNTNISECIMKQTHFCQYRQSEVCDSQKIVKACNFILGTSTLLTVGHCTIARVARLREACMVVTGAASYYSLDTYVADICRSLASSPDYGSYSLIPGEGWRVNW